MTSPPSIFSPHFSFFSSKKSPENPDTKSCHDLPQQKLPFALPNQITHDTQKSLVLITSAAEEKTSLVSKNPNPRTIVSARKSCPCQRFPCFGAKALWINGNKMIKKAFEKGQSDYGSPKKFAKHFGQ
jgi:hypothetical protein